MEWASSDLVGVISYLLPGFLAAWLFYGLTAHPKTSPFERVVQALIFTAIIQIVVPVNRLGLEWAGQYYTLGEWTPAVGQLWSLINAFIVGLVFALFANKDWFHQFWRWAKVTKRTSYPSEWFNALNIDNRHVILHLKDNRRIQGWPNLWPDHPDCGHFMLNQARWLLDDNETAELHTVDRVLIPATNVEMVEFIKDWEEIKVPFEELDAIERRLVALNKEKEKKNGKQSTTTTATSETSNTRPATGNGRMSSDQSDGSPEITSPTSKKMRKKKWQKKGHRKK
jgi:hypothetical protein